MNKKEIATKKVLVTGSNGFIGKNLIEGLSRCEDVEIKTFDIEDDMGTLNANLRKTDIVFHLAGVNRPKSDEEFREGNTELTRLICDALKRMACKPLVVHSSSTQARLDSPYGISKREAEEAVFAWGAETGAPIAVFRLPGVFGKWCRPNYNSVVATFCHNIARDLPISISDPAHELELVYIDDVVAAFIRIMNEPHFNQTNHFFHVEPVFRVSLDRLAKIIRSFRSSRKTLAVPDFSGRFTGCLYATYVSYLSVNDFGYLLKQHTDERGELAELLKSPCFGQIFVSRTRPGIVRGNHWHDTKVEKFVVLDGEAVIRFRSIEPEVGGHPSEIEKKKAFHGVKRSEVGGVIEYSVSGREFKVVDIPPGYTHSIENVGQTDLIVLFWANEIFDADKPDTYFEQV